MCYLHEIQSPRLLQASPRLPAGLSRSLLCRVFFLASLSASVTTVSLHRRLSAGARSQRVSRRLHLANTATPRLDVDAAQWTGRWGEANEALDLNRLRLLATSAHPPRVGLGSIIRRTREGWLDRWTGRPADHLLASAWVFASGDSASRWKTRVSSDKSACFCSQCDGALRDHVESCRAI